MATFFALQYRVLFHDTMAYGSHHFLTNLKFQCIARETLYFEHVVDHSDQGKADDASLVLLTQQGYTRNMAPVSVGQRVAILVSAEEPGSSSIRFCFRVIREDGAPVCCGFQTVVCVSAETGHLVPAPESILRGNDLMVEGLTAPSFADRAFSGRTRALFPPEVRALGERIATEASHQAHPRFISADAPQITSPSPSAPSHPSPDVPPGPLFLFPGQGSFRPNILKTLAAEDSDAAALLAYADGLTQHHFQATLSEALRQSDAAATEAYLRANPDLVQVGMYVSAVVIARSLIKAGARPSLMLGHSAGEIPALALAGAFEDHVGVEIVCHRALALKEAKLPPGGMVALMTSEERARATLLAASLGDLDVAVLNHPLQSVVAGPRESLERLLDLAPKLGLGARLLDSPYPFHTQALSSAVAPFHQRIQTLAIGAPKAPTYSPIEGRYLAPGDDIPALLASHFTRPLDFVSAIKAVATLKPTEIIECGPPLLSRLIPKVLGASQSIPLRTHPIFNEAPKATTSPSPDASGPKAHANLKDDDIVVTALGCVVPGGSDPQHFWESILDGRGGIMDGADLAPAARLDFMAPLSPDGRPTPDKTYTLLSGVVIEDKVEAWTYPTRAQKLLREALAQCLAPLSQPRKGPGLGHKTTHLFLGATADGIAEYDLSLMSRDLLTVGRAAGLNQGDLSQVLSALDLTPPPAGTPEGPYSLYKRVIKDALGAAPTLTLLDAACASSLYAIILGAMSLRDGACDLAICGGVFAPGPANSCLFSQFRGLSARGSDPLTAKADGVIFGEGASLIALRRFKDAKALGEPILGVLRGEGLGSDGKSPSVAVPKSTGQRITMARAYDAALRPDSIDYVEAHATSTPVGDAVEFGALGAVFEGCPQGSISLGSVKGLTGHTGWAAGSTSAIKMLKAMEAGIVPPQADFDTPNAKFSLETAPFGISPKSKPWPEPQGRGRRSAINSFGFGGANAHLVIERPGVASASRGGAQEQKEPGRAGWMSKHDPIVITALGVDLPGTSDAPWRRGPGLPPIPKGMRILPDVLDDMDTSQRLALLVGGQLLEGLSQGGQDWAPLKDDIAVVLGAEGKSLRGREITLRLHEDRLKRKLALSPSSTAPPFQDAIAQHLTTIPSSGPYTLPGMMPNVASGRVANAFGLRGPNLVVGAGAHSLRSALVTARLLLSQGRAKVALTGALVGNGLSPSDALPTPGQDGIIMVTAAPRSLALELGLPILSTLDDALQALDNAAAPSSTAPHLGAAQGAAALMRHLHPNPHLRGILGPDVPIERWYSTLQAIDIPPPRPQALVPERLIILLESEPWFDDDLPPSPRGPHLFLSPSRENTSRSQAIDLQDESRAFLSLDALDLSQYDGVIALGAPSTDDPWESLGEAAHGGVLDLLFLVMKHQRERLEAGTFAAASLCPLAPHHGPLHPVSGLFSGLLKSIARELPEAAIIAYQSDSEGWSDALNGLKAEWTRAPKAGSVEVISRGGQRLEQRLLPEDQDLDASPGAGVPWVTSRSVILATGGARGVTAELLEGVLKAYACTVILTGRTDPTTLPASWAGLSSKEAEAQRTRYYREELAKKEPGVNIAALKRRFDGHLRTLEVRETIEGLAVLPGRVEYISADVTDPASLKGLLDQSLARFGAIDWVIHGAGIQRSRGIAKKPLSELRQVIATKIAGLLAIRRGLESRGVGAKTRYHLLTSAFSHLGNDGQPDYGAANEAMGRLATYLDGGGRFTAMAWLGWASVGMTKGSEYAALASNRGLKAVTPEEGRRVFLPITKGCPPTPETILLTRGERAFYNVPEVLAPKAGPRAGSWSGELHLEPDAVNMVGDHLVRGQPTLPGTFEAELASRAAKMLCPQGEVVAMEGIRLVKFVRWRAGQRPSLIARARIEERAGGITWVRVQLLSDVLHKSGLLLDAGRLHFEACVGLSEGVDLLKEDIIALDPRPAQEAPDPYLLPGSPILLKGAFKVLDRVHVGPRGITGRFRCQSPADLPGLKAFTTPALLLDALFRLSMIQISPEGTLPINVPLSCGQTRLRPGLRDVDLPSHSPFLLLEAAPPERRGDQMFSPWARALTLKGRVLLDVRDLTAQGLGSVPATEIPSPPFDPGLGKRRVVPTEV